MNSILKELWIFSKEGIPLTQFCEEDSLDETLIGGFISAIKSYTQQLADGGLQSFKMVDDKFTLMPTLQGNVILVCRSSSKTKEKKVQQICEVICKIFEDLYDVNDLKNWNGDLSLFDKFRDRLDLYFKMSNL